MSRSDLDNLIDEALSAEDKALLERYAEPGYFRQILGLFRGPLGWLMWLTYTLQGIAFISFVYSLLKLFHATDAVNAVQWGVGTVLFFMLALFGKAFMGSHFEANRILRELKRVELQMSRLQEKEWEGPA